MPTFAQGRVGLSCWCNGSLRCRWAVQLPQMSHFSMKSLMAAFIPGQYTDSRARLSDPSTPTCAACIRSKILGLKLLGTTQRHPLRTRSLVAVEPRRPPMTDVGTETAFRLDQRKHFRKSKHLLRSEVNWCDQTSIELHLRRSTFYWWVDRSTCLASRISTEKESFPGSEFKPASIWTCWMLIDRQMQSAFMPELHRWISKLIARHLHHQDIFWSPW